MLLLAVSFILLLKIVERLIPHSMLPQRTLSGGDCYLLSDMAALCEHDYDGNTACILFSAHLHASAAVFGISDDRALWGSRIRSSLYVYGSYAKRVGFMRVWGCMLYKFGKGRQNNVMGKVGHCGRSVFTHGALKKPDAGVCIRKEGQ